MSDEESFVILGTSPTASMDIFDQSLLASDPVVKEFNEAAPQKTTNNDQENQLTNSAASSGTSQYTVVNKSAENSSVFGTSGNGVSIAQDKADEKSLEKPKANTMQNSSSSNSSVSENLAASFLMGQVDSNVLKSNLQSQFPSAMSQAPSFSDVPKELMEQNESLKIAVFQTNKVMQELCKQTTKWKKEIQEMDEKKKIEIAQLRNENAELRRDLEEKINILQLNENIRTIEQQKLIRSISEKNSQIKNMCSQIEKLEQHQLQSYEFIPKNDKETTYEEDESTEYITTHEHQRAVKDLQRMISELKTENSQLKDLQKKYNDELSYFKVQLVAAEELQKKLKFDINVLTARDLEKGELFTKYENECKSLKEEISILQTQLVLYSKDFKMEHEARENLANEKDQLISDLRELQKKNQELIKEAQRNYEEHARQNMAPTGAFPKRRTLPDPNKLPQSSNQLCTTTATFSCPLCARNFKTLSVLQEHVNQCLDGN